MRDNLLALAVIGAVLLCMDFIVYGGYSVAYLAYAVAADICHHWAWHFYRI